MEKNKLEIPEEMFELNVEEYQLFRTFNNSYERQGRHIDTYLLDNPQLTEEKKIELCERNNEIIKIDTQNQLENLKDYFEKPYSKIEPLTYRGGQSCETC